MKEVPLCVDLDGTLLKTDVLVEGVLILLRQHLYYVIHLFIWLAHGKAYFKAKVAEHADIDPHWLPYNADVLAYLRAEHDAGRELVLTTAAHTIYARRIADHIGIFSHYLTTEGDINFSGKTKAEKLTSRYGYRGFDYIANSYVDIAIWNNSRKAILVSSSKRLTNRLKKTSEIARIFAGQSMTIKSYLKTIRIHQWVKNLLIFVPLFASHRFGDTNLMRDCVVGFLSFSLCASGTYVINDLLDLGVDRMHPDKRRRMFASGELPLVHGFILAPALLLFAFLLAQFLPLTYSVGLAGYIILTIAYTTSLKTKIAIDVFVLAILFTYRILLGSLITEITPSFWLLAFSMFIFLSLALVKRCSELVQMQHNDFGGPDGRGYRITDLPTLSAQGIACGYAAILVLALYINDSSIQELYVNEYFLWGLCVFLLYWITRLWLKCLRMEIHSDPIVFAITDRQSLLLGLASGLMLFLASTPDIFA